MEVRVINRDEDSLTLELSEVNLSLANALRRHAINEVPVMAVEEVLVMDNSSVVSNEVLVHRISLIPFVTDLDNYRLPEECDCNNRLGCERCVVRFSLKASAVDEVVTVYSRDMVLESGTGIVRPVSGDFPIVKLAPGQTIELELYVRLGKGSKHAKWQSGIVTVYDSESGGKRLYIESFGFLSPERIITEAAKALERRVRDLGSAIEEVIKDG
ncbi:MAG: DNA-directed RNA polymerase subunit D [Thaumarchaeota archaeon]|nr:DNA-directed RNA polymerase subunit D [Candidatus Calditenuaceae archaeon]MDW8042080.1 DNA-directed RNA polymerase subunit D [Nitrososphaerota archaeon]